MLEITSKCKIKSSQDKKTTKQKKASIGFAKLGYRGRPSHNERDVEHSQSYENEVDYLQAKDIG